MHKRIPSISSLLAFEAAARYLSFTRAAIELNLSQAAISHQIKNLEELLGTTLFTRNANGLILTNTAKDYLESVRQAIIILSSASDNAGTENQTNILTIECLAAFAIKKLIPNLHKFRSLIQV
jgi:LysR family glycine cleavage system transcriptional activator